MTGNLVAVSYGMADTLADSVAQVIEPSDTLIVASFVNVNNLEESSSFGRIIAEQIASRFAQRGQRVIELKLRQNSIFISEGKGEFMLSRDLREISRNHNASAVVVGTYADEGDRLYVSARIVRPTDSMVISATDIGIPIKPGQHPLDACAEVSRPCRGVLRYPFSSFFSSVRKRQSVP